MGETSLLIAIPVLIYTIVTSLLPFFVMKIRSEVIEINKQIISIESLRARAAGPAEPRFASELKSDDRGRPVKMCSP
jgi:hypothetical protein